MNNLVTISANTMDAWIPVLEQVKSLTGFSEEDEELIQRAAENLLPCSQEIADEFHQILLEYQPTAEILQELDKGDDFAREKLKHWIETLLEGKYDEQFWTWHWVIGLVHVQYDLDYVDLMSLQGQLQKVLLKKFFLEFQEESALELSTAFFNLINCLATLAFKSYLLEYNSAIEASGIKKSVLKRMISMEVKNKLRKFSTASV